METFNPGELTFNLMAEASPNALILVNNRGNIVYVNSFTEQLFEYEKDELIGSPLEILIPDKFKNSHLYLMEKYLQNPVRQRMGENREFKAKKKGGEEFFAEIGLNPIVTKDGIYVLAAIIDITRRKKIGKQFQLVVESVPNSIVLVNTSGEITMINRQTESKFGYKNEELIGKNMEMLVPERFRSKHHSMRDMFIANPEARSMGAGRDLYALRKDGTEFPAEIGLNPIDTGTGLLVLASIIDITERKKYEDAIQANSKKIEEQNQKLKELNATKDKFFSIIAHDLKNPFNVILGFTSLLAEDYESFSEQEKKGLLSEINLSTKTTFALLENLLTWSLAQQGRIEVKKEELKLAELVRNGVAPYSPNSRKKNINIKIDISEEQSINADKYTMSIVIGNLVSNAVKYTPAGGEITISGRSGPDGAELRIKDSGIGMKEYQLERLFRIEESSSTLGTESEKGTGLGLILCKEFVEKNRGSIRVESEPEKGSVFIITLPVN